MIKYWRLFTLIILIGPIQACAQRTATTQELDIVSGDFAIPSKGRIISVDLVRFGNYLPRYNEAARTAAVLWLRGEGSEDNDLGDLLEDLLGETARQIVGEVEQNIRRSNCIYTIEVDSEIFKEQLINSFEAGGVGADKDFLIELILRDMDSRALQQLNSLSDDAYDIEIDRLFEQEYGGGNVTGTIEQIAVASQCLIGLNIGDQANLFFFGDRIAISPS